MNWRATAFTAAAIACLLGMPSPAAANGNNCRFEARGLSMSFGNLDPSNAVGKTVPVAAATLQADRWGECISSNTMTLAGGNGQNFSGGSRNMRNAAGDLIPYNLVGLPQSRTAPGNNTFVTFTFNGTLNATAYQNASMGLYTDTVLISVTP